MQRKYGPLDRSRKVLTEDRYWDLNDPSRAWTKRWQAERSGRLPTAVQAMLAATPSIR
jgi:hypothetical protein